MLYTSQFQLEPSHRDIFPAGAKEQATAAEHKAHPDWNTLASCSDISNQAKEAT